MPEGVVHPGAGVTGSYGQQDHIIIIVIVNFWFSRQGFSVKQL